MDLINRATVIVLDSVGIGALPDADQFGDEGVATLPHIAAEVDRLKLSNLEKLGLGKIVQLDRLGDVSNPQAALGRMAEKSNGKDTTTGHWELAGLISQEPFPTYPEGFPAEVMDQFHEAIGRQSLGNRP